jgi:ketosteroid isomerase-like protein
MKPLLSALLASTAFCGSGSNSDVATVTMTVNALRAGVAAHDGAAVLAMIRPEGIATVVAQKPDGTTAIRHPSWTDFVAGIKPGPQKFDPRFKDPVVKVNGDIAMTWTPYTFFVDGKLHHCGVNHFDLVRENGSWKILNITYTIRSAGCQ